MHRRGCSTAVSIGNGIGKVIRAVVILCRNVVHLCSVDGCRAVFGDRNGGDGERVPLRIRVVCQDADAGLRVLVDRQIIILGARRVIFRIDRNRYRGAGGCARAIYHGIGKRYVGGAVAIRAHGHRAVAKVGYGSVNHVCNRNDLRFTVFNVRIVREQIECGRRFRRR